MKEKLMRYILEGPWEEQFDEGMRILERFVIWPAIAVAVVYFGRVFFSMLTR